MELYLLRESERERERERDERQREGAMLQASKRASERGRERARARTVRERVRGKEMVRMALTKGIVAREADGTGSVRSRRRGNAVVYRGGDGNPGAECEED